MWFSLAYSYICLLSDVGIMDTCAEVAAGGLVESGLFVVNEPHLCSIDTGRLLCTAIEGSEAQNTSNSTSFNSSYFLDRLCLCHLGKDKSNLGETGC